jgi:hypothetical protein
MSQSIFRFVAVACAAILVMTAAFAQQGEKQTSPSDMQKMMAEYMKVGTPGPEHAKLATWAGDWVTHTTVWRGPDAPPMETPPGTSKGEMILGGRFLRFTETGDMMGMPMEGMGIMGYDNFRHVYQMIWVDNTETPIYFASGTADSSGKVITLMGKVDDPVKGEKDKDMKWVYRFESDTKWVFEMWDSIGGGKFYKSMETTYTKK